MTSFRVTITEECVSIEGFDRPLKEGSCRDFTCRTASHEAVGWAMKRLGEELEKSAEFYRNGNHNDKIYIE